MEPNLTTPKAEALCRRMCSGTTTRREDLTVLWVGGVLALVHTKGSSYSDNGGQHYVSGHINIVNREDPRESHNFDLHSFVRSKLRSSESGYPVLGEVHSCVMKPDEWEKDRNVIQGITMGRATPRVIQALIEHVTKIDSRWPALVAQFKAEAATKQEQERQSQARADARKVAEEKYKAAQGETHKIEAEALIWLRSVVGGSDDLIAHAAIQFAQRLREADAAAAALNVVPADGLPS